MKRLNKLGIGILLGCFFVNSINEKDFNFLKDKLIKHAKNIEPKLVEYFYDLNNLVNKEDNYINSETQNTQILMKLKDIKEELESIKSQELADLIIDELEKDEEEYE